MHPKMSGTEVIDTIIDLYNSGVGVAGVRNKNDGADSYFCTCCFAEEEIKGFCTLVGEFDIVKHREDCILKKLYDWAKYKKDSRSLKT